MCCEAQEDTLSIRSCRLDLGFPSLVEGGLTRRYAGLAERIPASRPARQLREPIAKLYFIDWFF
jgi:hypothetical protein